MSLRKLSNGWIGFDFNEAEKPKVKASVKETRVSFFDNNKSEGVEG